MGIYDTYDDAQIKVGDIYFSHFEVGDKVEISDGLYFAYEGVVVIIGGKFAAKFDYERVWDKWGGVVDIHDVFHQNNPIVHAVAEIVQEHKEAEKDENDGS